MCWATTADLKGSASFFTATVRFEIWSLAELKEQKGLISLCLSSKVVEGAGISYQTRPDTPTPMGSSWLYLQIYTCQKTFYEA